MFDIIALIFLTKNIGKLAYRKGLKVGWWKFYTVLFWLICETIGAVIGVLIFGLHNLVSVALVAIAGAVTSYFILEKYLSKLPDHFFEDEIDQIGHNEPD
jgi:hypothetical protein